MDTLLQSEQRIVKHIYIHNQKHSILEEVEGTNLPLPNVGETVCFAEDEMETEKDNRPRPSIHASLETKFVVTDRVYEFIQSENIPNDSSSHHDTVAITVRIYLTKDN